MTGVLITIWTIATLGFCWLAVTAQHGDQDEHGFRATDENGDFL